MTRSFSCGLTLPQHSLALHGQEEIFNAHETQLMMGLLWASQIGRAHNLDFMKITMLREFEKPPSSPGYFTSWAIDAPLWSQYDFPFLTPTSRHFFTPPGDKYASYLWELKIACSPISAHTTIALEEYLACHSLSRSPYAA